MDVTVVLLIILINKSHTRVTFPEIRETHSRGRTLEEIV